LTTPVQFAEITWSIGEIIGRGSFGTVYAGVRPGRKSRRLGRPDYPELPVAVKVWRSPPQTLEAMKMFMREIEISVSLQHPALLSVLTFSVAPCATVCERLPTDLDKVLQQEHRGLAPNGWDDTKKSICALGIAAGMCYLHEHNVIHRDLKTENVMLDSDLYPKITDYGLSKIMSLGDDQVNRALEMTQGIGTPLYMAPELFDDADGRYTTAIDVYAFGMLLYELYTCTKPFREKLEGPRYSLMMDIMKGIRPTIPDYVPEPLRELMSTCWAQRPEDRPTFRHIVTLMAETRVWMFEDIEASEYDDYLGQVLSALGDPPARVE
jgi:serine/threonine protein kinase